MKAIVKDAHIRSNKRLTGALWQLTVQAPTIAAAAEPGQFVHLHLGESSRHILRRPLSIHDILTDENGCNDQISLLYQVIGQGTNFLTSLDEGSAISLLGPLGHGWQVPEGTSRALLVGGGVGWASLALLAKAMLADGVEVHALIGARNADYLRALTGLSKPQDNQSSEAVAGRGDAFIKHLATDDGSLGHHGQNTELLGGLLSRCDFDYVATCGPKPMQAIVAKHAIAQGVFCQVSLESRMACGIGACLSCATKTTTGIRCACLDGPVFNAEEVVW